jgi:hypothetical protein
LHILFNVISKLTMKMDLEKYTARILRLKIQNMRNHF